MEENNEGMQSTLAEACQPNDCTSHFASAHTYQRKSSLEGERRSSRQILGVAMERVRGISCVGSSQFELSFTSHLASPLLARDKESKRVGIRHHDARKISNMMCRQPKVRSVGMGSFGVSVPFNTAVSIGLRPGVAIS